MKRIAIVLPGKSIPRNLCYELEDEGFEDGSCWGGRPRDTPMKVDPERQLAAKTAAACGEAPGLVFRSSAFLTSIGIVAYESITLDMIERAKRVAREHIRKVAVLEAGAEFEEELSAHTCSDCAHHVIDAIFKDEEPHPWGDCDAVGCQHDRKPPAPGCPPGTKEGATEERADVWVVIDENGAMAFRDTSEIAEAKAASERSLDIPCRVAHLVEVVHCRDCKRWWPYDVRCLLGMKHGEAWFCADGERDEALIAAPRAPDPEA